MRLERPRIRDASKLGFESRVLGKGVARTHALESLVISSFLRGLSTRDVEAALQEVFEEPIASKSTVSRICEDTRERYRLKGAKTLICSQRQPLAGSGSIAGCSSHSSISSSSPC